MESGEYTFAQAFLSFHEAHHFKESKMRRLFSHTARRWANRSARRRGRDQKPSRNPVSHAFFLCRHAAWFNGSFLRFGKIFRKAIWSFLAGTFTRPGMPSFPWRTTQQGPLFGKGGASVNPDLSSHPGNLPKILHLAVHFPEKPTPTTPPTT